MSTVYAMENVNPEEEQSIDTIINEIQSFGDIESLLRSGLTPEQVFEFMTFRAELVNLIFNAFSTPLPGFENPVEVLIEVLRKVQTDEISFPEPEFTLGQYGSPADILAACHVIVNLLQNSEPPVLSDAPGTYQSYLDLYYRAQQSLPASLLNREILTQSSDICNGSGIWRHAE